jgi:hypothetical protein
LAADWQPNLARPPFRDWQRGASGSWAGPDLHSGLISCLHRTKIIGIIAFNGLI